MNAVARYINGGLADRVDYLVVELDRLVTENRDLKKLVELSLAVIKRSESQNSVIISKFDDVLDVVHSLKTDIERSKKVNVVGKKTVINKESFDEFKIKVAHLKYKDKSSQLRSNAWKILKKIRRVRNVDPQDLKVAYDELYDEFAKVAGYHPYKVGKEHKNGNKKSGPSFYATCYNRGDFDLLLFTSESLINRL